jgi:hypothetical protein
MARLNIFVTTALSRCQGRDSNPRPSDHELKDDSPGTIGAGREDQLDLSVVEGRQDSQLSKGCSRACRSCCSKSFINDGYKYILIIL